MHTSFKVFGYQFHQLFVMFTARSNEKLISIRICTNQVFFCFYETWCWYKVPALDCVVSFLHWHI